MPKPLQHILAFLAIYAPDGRRGPSNRQDALHLTAQMQGVDVTTIIDAYTRSFGDRHTADFDRLLDNLPALCDALLAKWPVHGDTIRMAF